MYLKITDKCNMLCDHCGMNATMRGKHMTMDIFKQALEWGLDNDDSVSIGGGEPTMHPEFWSILGNCLGTFEYVWMATNGKNTKIALKLARMAQKGILGVALSRDPYHEEIEYRVVLAFVEGQTSFVGNDGREIRDTSRHLVAAGRAKKNNLSDDQSCICSDTFILPDGRIKFCGCSRSPVIGDVFNGISKEYIVVQGDRGEYDGCYQHLPRGMKRNKRLHGRGAGESR